MRAYTHICSFTLGFMDRPLSSADTEASVIDKRMVKMRSFTRYVLAVIVATIVFSYVSAAQVQSIFSDVHEKQMFDDLYEQLDRMKATIDRFTFLVPDLDPYDRTRLQVKQKQCVASIDLSKEFITKIRNQRSLYIRFTLARTLHQSEIDLISFQESLPRWYPVAKESPDLLESTKQFSRAREEFMDYLSELLKVADSRPQRRVAAKP
jgi:hypothetical protein